MNATRHSYVLPPPSTPAIPVVSKNGKGKAKNGDDVALFPVRRIFCLGRNYAAHAVEMGLDQSEPPIFFCKPADAIVAPDAEGLCEVPYPPATENLHHEVELVVALGQGGSQLSPEAAEAAIYGYGVGVDLTRRDLQNAARETGRPWDMSKGFDHSAPCSALVPVEEIGHPREGAIWLEVGDERRQDGNLKDMVLNVPAAIAALSSLVTLKPGDLLYTGTPAGVGALVRGDRLTAGIEGIGTLTVVIT